MSARFELFHEVDASVQDVSVASGSDEQGAAVDLSDCNGLLVHFQVTTANAAETGAGQLTLFESDDDVTYTPVDQDFILGDLNDADLSGTPSGVASYIGYGRYVKFGEVGLTDGDFDVSVWFTKHNLRSAPPSTPTV